MDTINPSVWAFLGVFITAALAYFSTRQKHKREGAVSLADTAISLMEQYRQSNEECQEELVACKKSRRKPRKSTKKQ